MRISITRRQSRLVAISVAAALVCVTAACSASSPSGHDQSRPLTLAEVGAPLVPGFNPFSTSDASATAGVTSLVYEPLIMYNMAATNVVEPWLASKYEWSDGGRELTFTIPPGRTWSDGKPLTAKDVAFTFNLIKKYPALNAYGITFTSASAPNDTTATLTFAAPAYTQLFLVSEQLIVPEHIWSHIADPATYVNATDPIGSGPYLLSSFTSATIKFTKNPHYWQPGRPKVAAVQVDAYTTQNASVASITAGDSDWSTAFLQSVTKQWTGVDAAHNKLWTIPAGDFFLCPNTATKPLNNPVVRQALAYSIDRAKSIPEVEGPFITPVTSLTGIRAGQEEYQPSAYQNVQLSYDPAKVRSLLTSIGYTMGSNGLLKQPDGSPLTITLLLPSQYTDWMSLGQLFVNQMKAAGIDASLDGVSVNAWNADVSDGQYQTTFCGLWQTDSPYTTYNTLLNGSLTAPVGKAAISNVVRWDNPSTNALLAAYQASGNPATQTSLIKQLATQVAQQMPIIPLMSVTSYGEYSTKYFTGWPDAADPYQTDNRAVPWITDVLVHLSPVSG